MIINNKHVDKLRSEMMTLYKNSYTSMHDFLPVQLPHWIGDVQVKLPTQVIMM